MEQQKIKRGTVREDGLVFLKNHFDKEIWLTREKYDSYAETYKNYITKTSEILNGVVFLIFSFKL